MPRSVTAYERQTSQQARTSVIPRVEVQNASGTWKDLGALLGEDYTLGVTWGESVDPAVGHAEIRIARKRGARSLAPLMSASALNVDDTAAYAPLLDIGRGVRVAVAHTRDGLRPGTNLLRWSESFSNAAWVKSVGGTGTLPAITAGYTLAPDGVTMADRVVLNIGAGTLSADISSISQTVTPTVIGQSYIHSVWMKTNDGTTKSVSLYATSAGSSRVTVTPAWQRFTSIVFVATTTAGINPQIRLRGTDGAASSADLAIWGAMVEQATKPSNYVRTQGSAGFTSYHEMFHGRIDDIDWSSDPIVLSCSDDGAWLMDTQMEVDNITYGSALGTPLETVMQSILTDNPNGGPAVALSTPVSPGFNVTAYTPHRPKLLEALRTVALESTGWDVRYRYAADDISRLTLLNPDRARVTVDGVITPNEYRKLTRLSLSLGNVRNAGRMPYVNSTTGLTGSVTGQSQASIDKYRRRYFELPGNENLGTASQAQAVLDTVINDLSGAPAEQEADCWYLWFVQLFDRYTFQANGVHYDQDQTLAVVGYEHTIEDGRASTRLTCSGRVVGAYAEWQRRISAGVGTGTGELLDVRRLDTDTTATIFFTPGPSVEEVWWGYLAVDTPETDDDWQNVAAAVVPLPAGTTSVVVPQPLDGQVVLVQLEPRLHGLAIGRLRRVTITAGTQVPAIAVDDLEGPTLGTQWVRFTERGIAIVSVETQIQVGSNPISGFGTPTRGPGAASLVKGGVLGAGEYEQDVPLDATRQSWVVYRYTLANGNVLVLNPFGFDRDKNPNLASVSVDATGRYVTIIGDVDTKSIVLVAKVGTWKSEKDGSSATFDVQALGVGGVAGLASGTGGIFTAKAQSDPLAYVTGSTLVDALDVTATNGASGAGGAVWTAYSAAAPADGSAIATITLKASAAPLGWTVKLYIDESNSTTNVVPTTDHTADVSPALATPPTALTPYSFTSAYVKGASGPGAKLITFKARADLLDSLGVVQDTRTVTATWYKSL